MTTNAQADFGRFCLAMFRAMKASAADSRLAGLQEWQREMIRPDIDDVMCGVARDNAQGSVHQYRGMLPDQPSAAAKPPVGRGGWIDPPQVRDWKPPGLGTFERIMDAQDAQDRAELERRYGKGGRE
jgi:hypothetical protein